MSFPDNGREFFKYELLTSGKGPTHGFMSVAQSYTFTTAH